MCPGRTVCCGLGAGRPRHARGTVRDAHSCVVVLGPFPCEAEGKEETGRMNENQKT